MTGDRGEPIDHAEERVEEEARRRCVPAAVPRQALEFPRTSVRRCSSWCDGPGPDWADRGPNPEDAIPIPCPACRRTPARGVA